MTQPLKDKLADLLCNVSQLLAGYMNDDCWSDWDESVRKSVIEMQYVIEELKKLPEDPTLKNFAELCAITHRKNLELKEKDEQLRNERELFVQTTAKQAEKFHQLQQENAQLKEKVAEAFYVGNRSGWIPNGNNYTFDGEIYKKAKAEYLKSITDKTENP